MRKKDEFAIYLNDDFKKLIGIGFNAFQVKAIVEDNDALYEYVEIQNRATKKSYSYFEFLEVFDK